MEIRFISTLTPDDEEHIAPLLLHAATALLDQIGIAYTLRVETTSEKVYQHNSPAVDLPRAPGPGRFATAPAFRAVGAAES